MAGFFIVLGDTYDENNKLSRHAIDTLKDLCQYGYYSTNLPTKENTTQWSGFHLSVFADYFSMQSGDYVFFFLKRKIYGVGKLISIGENSDCKFWSYRSANLPQTACVENPLFDETEPQNRCVCLFEPIEYYPCAIDMDEALTAFPASFKTLRVIEQRSFVKLDDEEAQALFAILSKRNQSTHEDRHDWEPPEFDNKKHKLALQRIKQNPAMYQFTAESIFSQFDVYNKDGISPEMAVEAALVAELNSGNSPLFDLTYVSHQVSASPAKPVKYMEWMDVFGYHAAPSLLEQRIPLHFAIDKYYVFELKKDSLKLHYNRKEEPQTVKDRKAVANQLMKYVDWVTKTFASGNYPMVKGVIIANDFDQEFIEYCRKNCVRNFNNGYRDSTPDKWHEIELIKYSFDGKKITFTRVYPT